MKIALIGHGKMGKTIEEIALQKKHEIVLTVDEHNASSFSDEALSKADVAIEFTRPEAAFDNVLRCFECNVPVVSGTTGWMDKMEEAKKICQQKKQAFFYASNYSIGVNIFFEVNKKLADMMNAQPQYDEIFINEIHHTHKLDAPSGTAITLAEELIQRMQRLSSWHSYASGESRTPVLKDKELPVFSSREGEVPGTHMVKYFSREDEIEIIHKAFTRKGFATGAVLAAEWIIGRKGVFGMKDLLNF